MLRFSFSLGFVFVFLLVINSVHCWKPSINHVTPKTIDVEEILQFIRRGEAELMVGEQVEEAVLVLGNTGAGKTTFTQWIAGDNSKLISVNIGRGTHHEYIIVDNNRISNSTLTSKTVFPELVVDKDTNTAYYDVSGFSDTRSIKNDIATSYFIKRIINQVQRIKIVLVVSHSSVRIGVDRKDFILLMTHVTELIKNIDKYEDSIALVVTKVDDFGQQVVEGTDIDENDILNCADFLMSAIEDLQTTADEKDSDEERNSCKNNMKLIANLLNKENSYNRIALFRRPNMAGSLDKIPFLQTSKRRVKKVVSDLKYMEVHANDFGFTVSDKTKNKINSLFEIMKLKIVENVNIFSKDLLEYYEGIMEETKSMNIIDAHNSTTVDLNVKSLEKHLNTVKKGLFEVSKLEHVLKHTRNPVEIAESIKTALEILKLDVSNGSIIDITAQANFMEFLGESSRRVFKFDPSPISLAIHDLVIQLERIFKFVETKHKHSLDGIEKYINNDIETAVKALRQSIVTQEEDLGDIDELNTKMKPLYEKLSLYHRFADEGQLKELLKVFASFNISLSDYTVQSLLSDKKYSEYFKNEVTSALVYLEDSFKWYKFTNALYQKLSQYEVQSNSNVKTNCIYILKQSDQRFDGRIVKYTDIDYYLENCNKDFFKTEYENIKNINITEHRIRLLKDVVNVTLNSQLFKTCHLTQMIVKGRFIKLSDVNFNDCPAATSMDIFGLEKVFIDTDLVRSPGKDYQVSIIAPTWEIIGERKFILDGFKGEHIRPSKASKEEDGKPGNPGTNGGNFLGLGNVFTNGNNLLISVNGGEGGAGQDGGDGRSGHDGKIPELPYRVLRYGSLERELEDNVEYWREQGFQVSESERSLCAFPLIFCRDFKVNGERCTNGGDGGRAGIGGVAGLAGNIQIFDAPFKISAKNGEIGKSGLPGRPGSKGDTAATISVHEKRVCYVLYKEKHYSIQSQENYNCLPGQVNLEINNKGRVWPTAVKAVNRDVLDKYMSYLKQNIYGLNKDALIKFSTRFNFN